MWTLIYISLALGINFYTPEIAENKKSMVINQKDSPTIGFPYQYFKGEVLTDEQVNYRIRVIYISFLVSVVVTFSVLPTVGQVGGQVVLPLPPPPVERLIPNHLNNSTRNSVQTASVIGSRIDKVSLTNEQMEEFDIIAKELISGLMTMEEAMLQLRSGGKFKDISWIVLYIWLYRLQNHSVQGFQPIRLPHQEWVSKGYNKRPLHVKKYGSSNPRSSCGLANTKGLVRLADCGTELYTGPTQSLKTCASRNQSKRSMVFSRISSRTCNETWSSQNSRPKIMVP